MATADEALKELIRAARGEDRSMAEFAKAIGISTASLYRIADGKIKRAVSDEILHAIADNAAEGSDVDYAKLKYTSDFVVDDNSRLEEFVTYTETRKKSLFHAVNEYMSLNEVYYSRADVNEGTGSYTNGNPVFNFGFSVKAKMGDSAELHLFKVSEFGLPADGFMNDVALFAGEVLLYTSKAPGEWYHLVTINENKYPAEVLKENIDCLRRSCEKISPIPFHIDVIVVTPMEHDEYYLSQLSLSGDSDSSLISLDSEYHGKKAPWEEEYECIAGTES